MASTYSPKLRFELIGAGEQAGLWGSTTNKNVGQLIEQAIAGVTTVELDGQTLPYTLTALDGAPDQSRSAVILCTYAAVPAAAPFNLIIPTQTKLYVIRNDCGQTITVKTSAQTGGVQLLNGEATLVFCDGTDAVLGLESASAGTLPVSGGGTGSTTFTGGFIKSPSPFGTTALTSVSTVNLATEVSGTLPVARGGTGGVTFTSGSILIGNGTSTFAELNGSVTGQVPTWNNSTQTWTAQSPASGGVTSVSGTGTVSGLTLSGTVTSTGSLTLGGTLTLTSGNVTTALGYTPYNGTTNPNNFITSSALSGYAQLSGSNSWSGSNSFGAGLSVPAPFAVSAYSFNMSTQTSLYGGTLIGGQYYHVNIDIVGSAIMRWDTAQILAYKQLLPSPDNSFSLGASGNRWTAVWAVNGSIQTSDQRLKTNVTNSQLGLSFINRLRPVSYKWIVGENEVTGYIEEEVKDAQGNVLKVSKVPTTTPRPGVRTHYGLISQEVKSALDAENVNDFGGWVLSDKNDPNSTQNLRYDQFISPLIKAVQELSAKVSTLEAEVAALKGA